MLKLIYTKEPGTWVMFVIAFITGVAKAGSIDILTVTVFISLSLLLMLKAPLSVFFKRKDPDILPSIVLYSVLGSAGCLYSVIKQPPMIFLYAAGFALMLPYFVFLRKGFPLFSEACGMAIMGLVASIAASLGSRIYPTLYLWGLFFAFYFASSFRVRLAIKKYRTLCLVYSGMVLLLSVSLAVSGKQWIYLSFLPLTEDIYAVVANKKESFKQLGIISTIKAVIFATLVAVFKP